MISSLDSAHWQPPCPDFEGKLDGQWWFGSYCNIHLTTHANHFQPTGLILMLIPSNFSLMLWPRFSSYFYWLSYPCTCTWYCYVNHWLWFVCWNGYFDWETQVIVFALKGCRKKFLCMLNWNTKFDFIHDHSSYRSLVMH